MATDFQVNTTEYHNQRRPDIATLDDNTYVVAWVSRNQDGSSDGVYAQLFDTAGNKLGKEVQVNSTTEGSQGQPSITSLSDGGYIIAWRSGIFNDDGWILDKGQDGSGTGIITQRFDSDNNPVGSEIIVNTHTDNLQFTPRIEGLLDGGHVIVWASKYQDGDGYGVYAQQYDAFGNKINQEFLVNDTVIGNQGLPDITSLNNGGYVITWQAEEHISSKSDVYTKVFNSDGVAQTNEFQVNTYTEGNQRESSIATLSNGDFVISWHSYWQTGIDYSGYEIYAQRFSESGNTIGSEFMVNTYTHYNQKESSVSALSDGGFVVTWHSFGQDGDSWGVYAQRYDAYSNRVGNEFKINSETSGTQDNPAVDFLSDGSFVVTWVSDNQDGSGYGVFSQRYDSSSNTLGGANNVYDNVNDAIATEDVAFELDISTNFETQLPGVALAFDAKLANGDDLPVWLSINSTTGIISGTPDNDDTGLLYISAIATNSSTLESYYDSFYLTIDNVNDAPTLTGDFELNISTNENSISRAINTNDVDEYLPIYKTTNWITYDKTSGVNEEDVYTFTNSNGDLKIKTYLENDNGTKVQTIDVILTNGDWYKEVRNYDEDGNFNIHFTENNGVDYYVHVNVDSYGNDTAIYSGNVTQNLGILVYDFSGVRTKDSDGVDTSYYGVSFTSDGRQITSTMDGFDEDGIANKVRYTQTDLGIDSLIKDKMWLSIENQQGIYGSLELTQDSEWVYTLDDTDPDTIALTGSGVDSFMVTLSLTTNLNHPTHPNQRSRLNH